MVLKEVEDTQPTPERGSVTSSSELRHRETSGSDDEVGQTVPVLTEAEPSDSPSRPTPASKNLQKPSYSRMKELDMARCVDITRFPPAPGLSARPTSHTPHAHRCRGRLRHLPTAVQLCRLQKGSWSAVLLSGGWGLVDCSLGSRLWRQSQRSVKSRVVDADSDAKHDGSSQSSHFLGSESCLSNNFRASEDPSTSLNGASFVSGTSPDRHVTNSLCVTSEKQLQCSPQYFYFLPEPKLLVSSHLPDDPWWQLLPRAVSDSEFHAALLLKPHFHYMSVELTKPKALRETDLEEGTEIVWKLKGGGLRRFAFRLFCPDDNNISEELTSYGFLENLPGRGEVRLKVGPPKSGRYVCEVYGAYLPTHGNHMMHMCSFELHFSRAAACPLQFPPNERLEWGPGAECMALGLRPLTHELGSVHVDDGQAEVAFLCSQRLLVTQKISCRPIE
ncbi:uncharacterized protein LOC112559651 [Pomacea canaliculata]|uniref:uncharacterized protein LOC112559651 n=1 Tax=Pomacea canaliculata TaxID=400727 RepID=UPI000D735373|nr:uncharacterized protein LOC112559651 [Pomacea canaliculata]